MQRMKRLAISLFVAMFAMFFCYGTTLAGEVIIGFSGPLSGPAAQYGRDNVAGLEMAIADLNKAGGITVNGTQYTFKLQTLDDHIDPTAAVNNARRLQARSGARVIYNPVFNTIAPMMQVNQERGAEFLMMAYTSTPAVDEIDNDLTISIPPPFSAYLQAFCEVAWDKGWRRGAMLVTLGAYGDDWRGAFREYWTKNMGGEITADRPANYYAETDFSSQIASILATNPDFILIGGPSDPTALVIEQARGMGFDGGFIMVDQAKMNYIEHAAFGGDLSLMENTIGVARTLDIGPREIMEDFHNRYKKQYGKESTSENVLNYSSMRMLAAAMEHAQTVDDPRAIKAAFSEILPMQPEENLVAYMGIARTRMLVPGTIQYIENGEYQTSIQNIWWTKDEEEFERVKGLIPERLVHTTWLPLEGYAK